MGTLDKRATARLCNKQGSAARLTVKKPAKHGILICGMVPFPFSNPATRQVKQEPTQRHSD